MNPTAQILPSPFSTERLRKKPALIKSDCGSVSVAVYRRNNWRDAKRGKNYGGHIIIWRDAAGRHLEKRADPLKAKARAKEIANRLADQHRPAPGFTDRDGIKYEYHLQAAVARGLTAEQLTDLGAARFDEITRDKIDAKPCPIILEELLTAMRAKKAGSRWVDDLHSRLDRFAKEFPVPLADLRTADLSGWLTRLKLGDRSWNNNRTALIALVKFARAARYVPAEWDELARIEPVKIEKGEEELYTPEEMRALVFTAEKFYEQHLPTLCIMGFAGCRHCELQDAGEVLDWRDVYLDTARIRIRDGVAKSNTGRRYVPMQPNLVAWLKPYVKPRGPVCVVHNLTNALARIARKSGIRWKQNALRNSFISYRCAVTENIAKVAGEAGNSVREIDDSYRQETPREIALSWWQIWPTREEELPLFQGGRW